MKTIHLNQGWLVFTVKNSDLNAQAKNPMTAADLKARGLEPMKTDIPNCLENVLFENGRGKDPFFSDNVFENRKNEYLHHFWVKTFDSDAESLRITFAGIDTVADIYLNGEYLGHTENMFLEHSFDAHGLKAKGNELSVHIFPAAIWARKQESAAFESAQKHNRPALYLRKCASSFGWDILPRIPAGGLWREVFAEPIRDEFIGECYLTTKHLSGNDAAVELYYGLRVKEDEIERYCVSLSGVCGNSKFEKEEQCWFTVGKFLHEVPDAKLWWPKYYGDQNLYDVTVSLKKDGTVIDRKTFRFGIRKVELERTSWACKNGKFQFNVNGKKIFILGSNWVTTDALHAHDAEHMRRGIAMVDDVGCNMIRIWGGAVYEREELFDICDEKGILIWQDFMMGCGCYPENETMCRDLTEEAISVVKKYRQHPSLALWAGDNECDVSHTWNGGETEPFHNVLTRNVLPMAVRLHDGTRPFLPSSPYVDEEAFRHLDSLAEDHLWGPRDYFKGTFYSTAKALFSSEIGYHGLNSPKSLEKFLKNPSVMHNPDGSVTSEYLAHASSPENSMSSPYAYRIKLFLDQVDVLFGSHDDPLDVLAKKSQISQAEAFKYFVERFRAGRNKAGGLIWWNILDGWPQISDAVVDYYFTKKLAYSYIKRSQQQFLLLMEERNGETLLLGVNDYETTKKVKYRVKNITTGESVCQGETEIAAHTATEIRTLPFEKDVKNFCLIEWEGNGISGSNHFQTNIIHIDYNAYSKALAEVGYDCFEGF